MRKCRTAHLARFGGAGNSRAGRRCGIMGKMPMLRKRRTGLHFPSVVTFVPQVSLRVQPVSVELEIVEQDGGEENVERCFQPVAPVRKQPSRTAVRVHGQDAHATGLPLSFGLRPAVCPPPFSSALTGVICGLMRLFESGLTNEYMYGILYL
jgi:hypothetical protein